MMRVITGSLIILLLSGAAGAFGKLNVAHMKKWTLVVPDNALPSEKYAAAEFQSLFKKATGIDLPIASTPPAKKHNVFIGDYLSRLDNADLGDEGLSIRIKKDNIAIAGGRPRGTLYGVYEFFEKYMGTRFLTYDDTYFPPKSKTSKIPCGLYKYIPPFSFRWSFYRENVEQPEFAARLHINTVTPAEKLGGNTPQNLINHSLCKWITPAKYGQTHPEYFALVKGERKLDVGGGGPQVCVTNPEVIEIVADCVIKELDADPTMRNISVSQNDNDAYCRCAKCEAINQREGTPMGSHLMFVNAVAERVEKKYPNVKIGTLAYWYTRKPPKTVVPRKNVQIQLCSIECCTLHAIDDPACPKNQEFCRDMMAWKAICDDIWVWNYNTNFSCYDMPFPNLRSIGANVNFFLKNNVKGVFMQANGNGTTGEMSDLRNYVMSRCLWHPGQDSWPLVEEFCRLHYKSAAQPILDYLTMLHNNAAEKNVHPTCFPSAEQVGLTPDIAQKAMAYFDDALAKADDDTIRDRVKKASICAYKAVILSNGAKWRFEDGEFKKVWPGQWQYSDGKCRKEWPEQFSQIRDRYIELCRNYKMTMATEGTSAEEYFKKMKEEYPAVRLENEVWRLTVLPEQNGNLVEMFYKPTGRHLIKGIISSEILKRSHEELPLKGFSEDKPVAFKAEADDKSLKLTKNLEDGSVIVRRIFLSKDNPQKIFFESSLTHNGDAPKVYQVKAHPEFDAGTTAGADVLAGFIKGDKWTAFNRDWKMDTGPDAGLLTSAKSGAFAFFNREAGYGVLEAYDASKIDHPYFWWNPALSQVNLELVTPAIELKKGESLSFSYHLEYLKEPPR